MTVASTEVLRTMDQLVRALEARGRQFQCSSTAEISVSQFESLMTDEDVLRLFDKLLGPLSKAEGGPLRLAEARSLYDSQLLATLCSILKRLNWRQFSSQLDVLADPLRGFMLASYVFDCALGLLHSWRRVQPPSDAASKEVFSRYSSCGRSCAHRPSWARLLPPVACMRQSNASLRQLAGKSLRFKSMVSFLHETILAFADIAAAIAQTGERAHPGYLVLAKAVTSLQQASPVPACLHSYGSISESALLPARGSFRLCR